MRLVALLLCCLWIGAVAVAGEPENDAPGGPPPKPEVRSLSVKSGYLSFNVLLRPGIPDPGQVVEITMDVAEVPPVPDPIYGERIPVKDTNLIAAVTDAAGYTMTYRVHKLQDAGSYGFHFTPLRKDRYQVVLKGVYKEKKLEPEFKVYAGIWPLKDEEGQAGQAAVASTPASSRLPALPSGMSNPAAPSGMASPAKLTGKAVTPLQSAMSSLGELWAKAGVALTVGRKPDLKEAASLAGQLKTAIREAAVMKPNDSEFTSSMKQLWEVAGEFEKAASSGKAAKTLESFKRIGSHHCNRCHFKMRWGLLKHLGSFPTGLP